MAPRASDPNLTALVVSAGGFIAGLDSTIISTALPQMAHSFHTAPVALSIGITVYVMAAAVFLPLSGWLADRFGGRDLFIVAIAGFTLSSMLCGMSATLPQFVGGRVLQGMFATLMTPVGRLLLLRSSERADLVRLINLSTMPGLIAPVVGPALGGYLTTYWSWPWVFFLNVPVGIVGVILAWRFLPNPRAETPRGFDPYGIVVNGVAMTALIYGLDRISQPNQDWRWPALLMAVGLGFGMLALRHARTHPHPALSLAPLRHKVFAISALTGGTLVRLPIRAVPLIMPIMFQVGFGMTAFTSGLLLLTMTAADVSMKWTLVRVLHRFGYRQVLNVASIGMCVTFATFALFRATTPLWIMFALIAVVGMFRSYVFSGVVTLMADVPPEELGPATTMSNVLLQVGNAIGVSTAAILMNVSAAWRGGAAVGAADCRFALVAVAVIGLSSVLFFRLLPPDAGAEIAGRGT